ncbi:MAG: DUF1295 domain-containing protein [Firmicutes bacterium]|nr:DUF1295 domain-containing protein [Bacillota bacterium]
MVFPDLWWIPVVVSLLLCCMGFYRFVWFMSIGYGISSAGIGLTMLIMALTGKQIGWLYAVQGILFIVYGIRLGGFLLVRELKNVRYREKMRQVGGDVKVPVFVAVFMWIYCGVIYVMQSSGFVYRFFNGDAPTPGVFAYIGCVICLIGLLTEAIADKQKSAQKAENPDMPAMKGLYKLCRCPNYLGEIIFWTGVIISGIGSLKGAQWIVAAIGYIQIVYVMIAAAKRVEGRHIRNYGEKPEYNAYADSTPILFPFVPWYHLTSPEKLAAEAAAKKAKQEKRGQKHG